MSFCKCLSLGYSGYCIPIQSKLPCDIAVDFQSFSFQSKSAGSSTRNFTEHGFGSTFRDTLKLGFQIPNQKGWIQGAAQSFLFKRQKSGNRKVERCLVLHPALHLPHDLLKEFWTESVNFGSQTVRFEDQSFVVLRTRGQTKESKGSRLQVQFWVVALRRFIHAAQPALKGPLEHRENIR